MKRSLNIPVGVSNRHVHLTKESVDILFGKDYELTKKNDLTQPGQFACNETVTILTPKSQIEKVRVLGPIRKYNQIEISKTDAYKLGLNPPVRRSGNIKGSAPITLIGPKGKIDLEEGCILATRHVHISKEDALIHDLVDNEEVYLVKEGEKGGIFDHVFIKVMDEAFLEVHLDTDDANSFLICQGDIVTIVPKTKKH